MNKSNCALWLPLLISLSVLLTNPGNADAQTTNQAPATKKLTAAVSAEKKAANIEKKPSAHPFHGRLTHIEKIGKSFTVGKTTYYVGPETKIKKDGQPAALEEGVLEEQVTGYVKPDENGKMVASTINFGGKGSTAKKEKTKSEPRTITTKKS